MTHHPRRPARVALAATGLALALGLVLLPGAAPAGAHEGTGKLVVEQVHPAGLSVHYIVRLTWANDGHPAEGATVTATAVGPGGATQTPVPLSPSGAGDGRYSGPVEFSEPGEWTVRFTSIEPTGSAQQSQQVIPPTTTTAGNGDDAANQPGVALADDGTGKSAEESDGGGMPVLLILVAAVVAIGGLVTAVMAIRRARPDLTPIPDEPGTATEPAPGPAAAAVADPDAGDPGTAEPEASTTGEPEPEDPDAGDPGTAEPEASTTGEPEAEAEAPPAAGKDA